MSEKNHENATDATGDWAWRVAMLFPPQGSWTEQDYLSLDGGRLIEFENGCIEVHDTPTIAHQRIVRFIFAMLASFVEKKSLGEVFFAPLPVQLWNQKFREPDIIFVSRERHLTSQYPNGADLAIEVVSQGAEARHRDMNVKVGEYAQANISEYWVVDQEQEEVIVYRSPFTGRYLSSQRFARGQVIVSGDFSQLVISVSDVFDACRSPKFDQGS